MMKIPASVAEKSGLYVPTIITQQAAEILLSGSAQDGYCHILTAMDAQAVSGVLDAARRGIEIDLRRIGVVNVSTVLGVEKFTYILVNSEDAEEAPTLTISIL